MKTHSIERIVATTSRASDETKSSGRRWATDDRPIGMIAFGGRHADAAPWNVGGQHPSWFGPDPSSQRDFLARHFARPFDVFLLHEPAGWLKGQNQSMSQWRTMTESQREALHDVCTSWLAAKPGRELYVYVGGRVTSPWTLDVSGQVVPDRRRADHLFAIRQTIDPFVEMGCTRVYFDASAKPGRRDAFVRLFAWLNDRGVVGGFEAVPHDSAGPRLDHLRAGPALAMFQRVRRIDPHGSWWWPAEKVELACVFSRGNTDGDPDAAAWEIARRRAQGWRVGSRSEALDALVAAE